MSKECQNRCQIECQKGCQRECQNKCAIYFQMVCQKLCQTCFRVGITLRKQFDQVPEEHCEFGVKMGQPHCWTDLDIDGHYPMTKDWNHIMGIRGSNRAHEKVPHLSSDVLKYIYISRSEYLSSNILISMPSRPTATTKES